ncbi:MAG: helix-turn-helix domain-containing protein [Sinobacteraceae bacterium]|nr:helix-turn-helix domain-containing protein [Nevskiaceae bacterium]
MMWDTSETLGSRRTEPDPPMPYRIDAPVWRDGSVVRRDRVNPGSRESGGVYAGTGRILTNGTSASGGRCEPPTTRIRQARRLSLCDCVGERRNVGTDQPAPAPIDTPWAQACVRTGNDSHEAPELMHLIEPAGPYAPGDRIFRSGDDFRALYVVRTGAVKTERVDIHGRVQVLEFHLPGELLGLYAIYPGHHVSDAIALATTECCRLPFAALNVLATRSPRLQQALFGQLSRELGVASRLASDRPAENRVAACLIDLGDRHATRDPPGTTFDLRMTHADLACHLRLAPETLSRVLGRWRRQRVIALDGHRIELLNLRRLCQLAHA